MQNWRWGELHRAFMKHTPMSDIPILNHIFTRTPSVPGDAQTVCAEHVEVNPDKCVLI